VETSCGVAAAVALVLTVGLPWERGMEPVFSEELEFKLCFLYFIFSIRLPNIFYIRLFFTVVLVEFVIVGQ
jgi:hypothetical protein